MDFILIFGPPAVGKMTVGKALSNLTDFKFFHNHMVIELLLPIFEWGSDGFRKLNKLFRFSIFEEIANNETKGMIFIWVWALNVEADKKYVDEILEIFKEKNWNIYFVELEATLDERIRRNKQEDRIREKPSKKDIVASEKRMMVNLSRYKMNSDNDFFYKENYIKIDNTNLSAEKVSQRIVKEFNLVIRTTNH